MSDTTDPPSADRLAALFARLRREDRGSLLAFAEFLAARGGPAPASEELPPEPTPLPRPAKESVVAAMKRLSASYPMIDKGSLLHEASGLMSQHILQGRAAAEVIDDLEALFERQYRRLTGRLGGEG